MEITNKGPSKTSSPLMQSLRILIKFGNRFALLGERTVAELESGVCFRQTIGDSYPGYHFIRSGLNG